MAESEIEAAIEGGPPPPRRGGLKRLLITLLKITIAVAGLVFVLTKASWKQPVTGERSINIAGIYFAPAFHWDDTAILPQGAHLNAVRFDEDILVHIVSGKRLQMPAKAESVWVQFPDQPVRLSLDDGAGPAVQVVVAEDSTVLGGQQLGLASVKELPSGMFQALNGEKVHTGVRRMLIDASAKWYLILAAWAILIIPFLVSSFRWRALMRPQGIELPYKKCIELTFVGQFYSIMLPGITGGDLVKIVYTARLTGSKTKSLITILLDRVIGLIALMVIAGVAAGLQLLRNHQLAALPGAANAPVLGDATLRNVLLLILGILGGMGLFALVYFSRRLRSLTRLQRIIDHPRMPEFVKHADEVLHRYRGHFGLLAWAFIISIFSQLMLPLSAWLCGIAFGMDAHVGYYLAYVPIAVLASSLPISPPQGFGVMDSILVHFFVSRGTARVGQVFALTQAIRFIPLLWNLIGAYWVITGRFSRHEPVPEGIEVE